MRSGSELRLISQPSSVLPSSPQGPRVRVLHAVGTRADLLQLAAVAVALGEAGDFEQAVVDVGPCADAGVLAQLGVAGVRYIPLEVGSGHSAEITSRTLRAADELLDAEQPEIVLTAGESDATLAWSLAAAKRHIAVALLDAGIRSWDWSDLTEINRVVCDRLADTLFAVSPEAVQNLLDEGVPDTRIHEVGSTTTDTVMRLVQAARSRSAWADRGLEPGQYLLVALTQPANTDDAARAVEIAQALAHRAEPGVAVALLSRRAGQRRPSPALAAAFADAGVQCLRVDDVIDELSLVAGAGALVTDSGVLQDVASSLGVSCFVLGYAGPGPATRVRPTCIPLGDDIDTLSIIGLGPWPPNLTAIPVWESRAASAVAEALKANFVLRAATPHALS